MTAPGRAARRAGTGTAPAARQVAEGVHLLRVGPRPLASNVYLVSSGPSWVLVDAGWPGHDRAILAAAERLFGEGARPEAIVLTHLHSDHSGSAPGLARHWDLPVHLHPEEVPARGGEYLARYGNALDRWIVGPIVRLLPPARRARLLTGVPLGELDGVARYLGPDGAVPGLPDWRAVPTPGHTPGHVSFHRPRDGVLITGDALLTMGSGMRRRRPRPAPPPALSTWSRSAATHALATLAALGPSVVCPGHGRPLTRDAAAALRAFAERRRRSRPLLEGFLGPVDYTTRTRYRPPPPLYARVQGRLGPALIMRGLAPRYAVVLEVPGRRTGLVRRTSLVQVEHDGRYHVVSLAGESAWVRNVRAAGGRAVLGRAGRRRAVTLVEVPVAQRAPVILAYLHRAGPRGRAAARAREARRFFGVDRATPAALAAVAEHYPVFRVDGVAPPPSIAAGGTGCARRPTDGARRPGPAGTSGPDRGPPTGAGWR